MAQIIIWIRIAFLYLTLPFPLNESSGHQNVAIKYQIKNEMKRMRNV